MTDNKVKTTRGRKKREKKESPGKIGITDVPEDPNCTIEFSYTDPMNIRRLWQIFKAMKMERNNIFFQKDKITISGHGGRDASKVRCIIDCSKVDRYYCAEEKSIVVDSSIISNLTMRIDKKTFDSIHICCDSLNNHSIRVNLKANNGAHECHEISITDEYDEDSGEEADFSCEKHNIFINMDWKYFKKTISSIKNTAKTVSIIQNNYKENVFIEYITKENKVDSKFVVPFRDENPKGMHFVSHISENDIFSIVFRTELIKPISSVIINDFLEIYIDEEDPLKIVCFSEDTVMKIMFLIEIEK